jgi:hypothetical protein
MDTEDLLVLCFICLISFTFVGALTWISASNEAAAFNRLTTGPKVTTWDAVWLDLRVEAQQ